jgi:uncharacterized membrane protein
VVLVTVVAFFAFRASRWRGRGLDDRTRGPAEAVLAERYARGEITEEEYRRARATLKENDS